jgi:hypothetical protein
MTDDRDPYLPNAEVSDAIARHAAEHERFAFDDAAYVLGALSEVDRIAFEAHLESCPLCQSEVADLRDMPDMLRRADPAEWTAEPPPETLMPRLLRRVEQERRSKLLRTGVLGFAAACLVAALVAVGLSFWRADDTPRTVAMQTVGSGAAPVHAKVAMSSSGSGTKIQFWCGYDAPDYGKTGQSQPPLPRYKMLVFNKRGAPPQEVSTWEARPLVEITTSSDWAPANISKIEITRDDGTPVLRLVL